MKTRIILLFFMIPTLSMAQFGDNNITVSFGLGYGHGVSYAGRSSKSQLNIYMMFYNVYLDGAFNIPNLGEEKTGTMSYWEDHRLINVNLGYSLPLYKDKIYVIPLLGVGANQTLDGSGDYWGDPDDEFYDDHVVSEKIFFCYGASLALRHDHIIAMFKFTNEQRGISIGYCF